MMRRAMAVTMMTLLSSSLLLITQARTAEGAEGPDKQEPESGVIYQKKTIVSFDEDTIDGNLQMPDGEYVESRKRVRHSNLIRIRDSFRQEILLSVSRL